MKHHAKLPFSLYSIRIPKKMRNDLEDFANRNEMQVSDAVRLAVTEMLNRENKKEQKRQQNDLPNSAAEPFE